MIQESKSNFVLLSNYKDKLNIHIDNFINSLGKEAFKVDNPLTNNYITALSNTIKSGGKRVRPALMYYTYILAGGKENEEIIKLSMFLEVLQSYLLIHDDIIDKSPMRRKEKTTQIVYKEYAEQNKLHEPERYGEMVALLIGDIANNYIMKIVLDANISDSKKLKLLNIISMKTDSVLVGQIEDLNLSLSKNFTKDDIRAVHQDKTVTYSFELPILAGLAISDNKDKKLTESLTNYAKYCGHAFQIRDDIIGIFGDPLKTGKPNDSDVKEGKKTYLLLETYKNANKQESSILDNIIGNPNATQEEIDKIRKIIMNNNGKEYAQNLLTEYTNKAKDTLHNIRNKGNIGYQFFEEIIDLLSLKD